MSTTTHLGISLVAQAQAQKEVTVNAALTRIDALMNTGAKSRSISTPPGSPASGDLYIVGSAPTGAWSGQAFMLAYYDQIWRFLAPNEGISLWVNDENLIYSYNGSAWTATIAMTGQGTLTDGATIAWDVNANRAATLTLGGNHTLANPTNLLAGGRYSLIVKQDATGSRTLAYGSAYKWPSGTAPVLSTAANATDLLTFVTDGTNLYGSFQKGFA